MDRKQNPYDLGLLVAGVGLIVGSFSPWISVLIVNIAGTAGFRGYITLISGLIVSLYAATRLWPNLLDAKFSSKLNLLSKISLAASVIVLIEVAIRIKQVAGQMNDVADTQPVTQATDDIFGDFAKSLTDAFKPRLAMGWYICLLSVVVAVVLVLKHPKKIDAVDEDQNMSQFNPPPPPPLVPGPSLANPKKPFYKRTWFLVIAGLLGLIIISAVGFALSGGDSSTTSSSNSSNNSVNTAETIMDNNSATTQETSVPKETAGQKNARNKAETYLDIMPFSKSGLIKQLNFEGFSDSDATYAVNAITVEWNQQAALKAKTYLDIMAFSRSGLITQLLFDGFTKSQAEYGVSKTGL